MYFPSGVTTLDMGSVSSAICLPTGWRRQPLLSRKPPVARGPTCSRGAVCELKSAPRENRTITSAMRLRMDLVEGCICFNIVSLANVGCGYDGVRAGRFALMVHGLVATNARSVRKWD